MKIIAFASLLIVSLTNSAFALSCLQPSLEFSFKVFAKSEKSYILVHGTLSAQRDIITAPLDDDGNGQGRFFTATFTGMQGNRAGFQQHLSAPVKVRETCAGPWCGSIPVDGTPFIGFFETTPYGLTLEEGPCKATLFYNPSDEEIDHALQCLRGGVCTPH